MAGDFALYVTARFNNLNTATLSTIFENGITGQIGPRLAMSVRNGKLTIEVTVTSGGATILLETSQVPLGTNATIGVTRQNGNCNLGVDGAVVVSTPCANSAIIPAPSSNNVWTTFGVGAQKEAAASCAQKINAFTVGYIHAIRLIGGEAKCSSCIVLKVIALKGR